MIAFASAGIAVFAGMITPDMGAISSSLGTSQGVAWAASAPPRLQPVEVVLNQSPVGTWTLLDIGGGWYATAETLRAWRVQVPVPPAPVNWRDQVWYPLFVLPGYRARFDVSSQSVTLDLAASAFVGTRLASPVLEAPVQSPVLPALALNYDLSHTELHSASGGTLRDTGALGELALSGPWGVLASSAVGRHLGGPAATVATDSWRRLQTTWTVDFPERPWTLRVGDTVTRPTIWGRSFYLGGIQLGTHFGLQPQWSTMALPSLVGAATGPSTVELYVNDALRQTQQVPAGPFTLENLNPMTGAGEARLVVRDVLGRETVVVRPFFTSTQLLRAGLSDWSVEVGRLRFDIGTASHDYRSRFVQGWIRHGWTSQWTLEGSAQASPDLRRGSVAATGVLVSTVLAQLGVSGSDASAAGRGGSVLLGLERSGANSQAGLRWVQASSGYRELGLGERERPLRHEGNLNLRRSWGGRWSVGLNLVRRHGWDGSAVTTGAASAGWTSSDGVSVSVQATRVAGSAAGHAVMVMALWPLDGRQVLAAQATRAQGRWEGHVSASSPMDGGAGLGWRALAGTREGSSVAEAGAYWQAERAFGSVDVRSGAGTQAVRLGAQGALAVLDGSVHAAARLQEGFALVEVPGQAGVRVAVGGAAPVRTDRQGRALLPRLLPHQDNAVRIEPNDLPVSAEVDGLERRAVPGWRSAVKVVFPVRQGRAALVRLVLDDGEPAPARAEVSVEGDRDDRRFIVGRRGEAYLNGIDPQARVLHLHWQGRTCSVPLAWPAATDDEVPRLGPWRCSGVTR